MLNYNFSENKEKVIKNWLNWEIDWVWNKIIVN